MEESKKKKVIVSIAQKDGTWSPLFDEKDNDMRQIPAFLEGYLELDETFLERMQDEYPQKWMVALGYKYEHDVNHDWKLQSTKELDLIKQALEGQGLYGKLNVRIVFERPDVLSLGTHVILCRGPGEANSSTRVVCRNGEGYFYKHHYSWHEEGRPDIEWRRINEENVESEWMASVIRSRNFIWMESSDQDKDEHL